MSRRGFSTRFTVSFVGMLAVANLSASPAQQADEQHIHAAPVSNALVKLVREVTGSFKDVAAAKGQDALIRPGAHGTEVPAVRGAEPVWAVAVLHAARVGMERKPHGHVRELALEYFVRRVLRPESITAVGQLQR
jgi:hypothetical protein